MQFLRTLFWVVLAVAAVIFAMRNWTPVQVNLWGPLLVEAKLPVLVYGAFLIGFLPVFGWHRAARWRLQRRLDSQERTLAEIRSVDLVPAPLATPATAAHPIDPAPASPLEPPAAS